MLDQPAWYSQFELQNFRDTRKMLERELSVAQSRDDVKRLYGIVLSIKEMESEYEKGLYLQDGQIDVIH